MEKVSQNGKLFLFPFKKSFPFLFHANAGAKIDILAESDKFLMLKLIEPKRITNKCNHYEKKCKHPIQSVLRDVRESVNFASPKIEECSIQMKSTSTISSPLWFIQRLICAKFY